MATLCTFNINNLFLRYKFGRQYPGDMSGKSKIEERLWGYLPMNQPGSFTVHSEEQRALASLVLRLPNGKLPDILCLQEVESLLALRAFNERYLDSHYSYAALIDCRDLRQIDVGILSTKPISCLRTNIEIPDKNDSGFPWLFSRDCLEATIELNKSGSETLTVFINHFKSKLVQGKTAQERAEATERANKKRERQAKEVKRILETRFPGNASKNKLFAVVGDLNDEPLSKPLKSLIKQTDLENVLDRLPEEERWTHYYKSAGQVSQFDYLLLSPALSKACASKPFINRTGIGCRDLSKKDQAVLPKEVKLITHDNDQAATKIDFRFVRLDGVGPDLMASDHCPLSIEF